MSSRGHPQKPLSRRDLPLESLVNDFLEHSRDEEPSLAAYLDALDEHGRRELAGVLGRFDAPNRGVLDAAGRLCARRLLTRIHRPSRDSLVLTNRILDYLDLDHDALLAPAEVELILQVFETFARTDSKNDTLSELELELLYAVLRYLDRNHNGKLDAHERQVLREGLAAPTDFWEAQQRDNPLVREALARRRAP